MLTRRRLSVLVLVASLLAPATAWPAQDETVEQTQAEAVLAEGGVAEADRLVKAAIANRDRIEAQMLVVLDRYERASRRLEEVSVGLERVEREIDAATASLYLARSRLSRLTVDDYMRAVAASGVYLLAATHAADTVVIGETLLVLSVRTVEEMNNLGATRRLWERLADERAVELAEVTALATEIEEHTAALADLFRVASIDVAIAEDRARAADLAAAAETSTTLPAPTTTRPRVTTTTVAKASTTTVPPPTSLVPSTTVAVPPPTSTAESTTTTTAPTTTIPGETVLGPFPAEVERWRPLTSIHFPPARVDEALYVIDCESNGDPNSVNPYSGAAGLFQFLPGTWTVASTGAGIAGASVFDPEANIAAAAWLVAYSAATSHPKGAWGHWSCRPPT